MPFLRCAPMRNVGASKKPDQFVWLEMVASISRATHLLPRIHHCRTLSFGLQSGWTFFSCPILCCNIFSSARKYAQLCYLLQLLSLSPFAKGFHRTSRTILDSASSSTSVVLSCKLISCAESLELLRLFPSHLLPRNDIHLL